MHDPQSTEPLGLRDRKKAKRREDILEQARQLFATQGVDATTIGDIANAVDVSAPTVFNYFGNKDGLLIALITEGAEKARAHSNVMVPRTDLPFGSLLTLIFSEFSEGTLRIANKRIWRYAEAAAIRHPTTELSQSYAVVNEQLQAAFEDILLAYDIKLRSRGPVDTKHLAQILFDVWNAAFFELIKDSDMTIAAHKAQLGQRIIPLCHMLFTDEFLASPSLKGKNLS